MTDDHRGRIAPQRNLDDFAQAHFRRMDRAAEQLGVLDQLMLLTRNNTANTSCSRPASLVC